MAEKTKEQKDKKQKSKAAPEPMPKEPSRYAVKYREEVVPAMMEEFKYTTVMQVPRLVKIVLNMGVGNTREEPKQLENAMDDLRTITGQEPVKTRSRKAISNFKIREGWDIGTMVTLRGRKMYDFLDRFINMAVPRIRDFRGLPVKSFDGRGNFSVGVREQVIFTEIEYDKIDRTRGMDIVIVTTAPNDAEGQALLRHFGMPFAGLGPVNPK
jgi:large subunit ribosomal protein L5